MVGPRRVGPRRVGRVGGQPQKSEGPKLWGPEGWGPEGWGPERWGPKISRFFFPLPPQNSFFSSLSFGLFRGILVVFEASGPSNVHVWSSRAVVCEPGRPGLVGPPGFHTTTRESKRAHLRVSVFKNPPKFNEKQQEREKRIKTVAGERKKRAKFWAVRRGPEHPPHTQHKNTTHSTNTETHNWELFPTPKPTTTTQKKGLAKNGLAQKWQTTNH